MSAGRRRRRASISAAVNDLLQLYWPRLGLEAGSEVFVPLCGRSLDMVWLADQGHRVIGAELSQIAIDEFFAERGFTPATSTNASFNVKSAGPFEIWCGDFFDLPPSATAGVAGVYDRASLIAFPAAMQGRYAAKLKELAPPEAPAPAHHSRLRSKADDGAAVRHAAQPGAQPLCGSLQDRRARVPVGARAKSTADAARPDLA